MAIFNDPESRQELFDLIDKFDSSKLFELEITLPPQPTKIKMMKLSRYAPEGPVKVTVGNGNGNSGTAESIKLQRNNFSPVDLDPDLNPEPPRNSDSGGAVIKAPLVGTFYISPSPDAEPYVKIGDKITGGMVLCIIEAMKTMNEIESETDGEIAEILVKNGSPVEYGQPLFRLK